MLLSTFNEDNEAQSVALVQFDRKSGALIHEVGTVFVNMPVARDDTFLSNIAERAGVIYFVSNRVSKLENGVVSHKLYLSSYDLRNKTYNETLLDLASASEISISIGVIESHLCLSYHGVGAQISVEFIDLGKDSKVAKKGQSNVP